MSNPINLQNIREILVIRLNKIGDMICTIPLIKTLKYNFKGARITVFCEESSREIVENNEFVDNYIIYKKSTNLFRNKYLKCFWLLENYKRKHHIKKFDIAIGVKGGFSSFLSMITFISRASLRIGYVNYQNHYLNKCYNLPVYPIDFTNIHQVDACLNLLKPLGITNFIRDLSINIPSSSINSAINFLYSNGLKPNKKLAIFNISNNRHNSKWSSENFIKLAELLYKKINYKCIITCSPDDWTIAINIYNKIKKIGFFYETKKLMDFAAIASMGNLLVAGDGGAVHVGTAVGTRVIALFGETNPNIFGPYGNQHITLKSSTGNVNSISPEDVINTILENLA